MPTNSHALNRPGRHQDALLLGAFALVHLVATVLWLREDHLDMMRVPDEFSHYWALANLHAALSLDLMSGALNGLRMIANNYPLVGHFPRAAAGLLLGPSPLVFCAANVVYTGVLLVSIYHIGRRCHGRRAGLLAAALVSLTPAVYGGARSVGLDYPAMCMTCLAMLMLLRSDGFRRLPDSVGFGVCAGLAVLIKGQCALFLVWPAAYLLVRSLWQARARGVVRWRPLVGGGLAVLVMLLTTAVWWAGRLGNLARYMGAHTTGDGMLDVAGDISFSGGVIHYVQALPLILAGPLAVATLLVLPAFLFHARHRWMVLIWLVAPLVVHMALSVRHPRYIFPLVPAAALVLAVGLCSLKPRLRSVLVAVVGALAVISWLCCTCFSPPAPARSRPLRCYKEWPVPEPAILSNLVSALLSCGNCEYAGSPSAPLGPGFQRPVASLTRMLRAQDPREQGILVYSGGAYMMAQSVALASRTLPAALFLDPLYAQVLLPSRPRHGRKTFVLWEANTPLPLPGGLERLSTEPLRFRFGPDVRLQMHLYRSNSAGSWPHQPSPE